MPRALPNLTAPVCAKLRGALAQQRDTRELINMFAWVELQRETMGAAINVG